MLKLWLLVGIMFLQEKYGCRLTVGKSYIWLDTHCLIQAAAVPAAAVMP